MLCYYQSSRVSLVRSAAAGVCCIVSAALRDSPRRGRVAALHTPVRGSLLRAWQQQQQQQQRQRLIAGRGGLADCRRQCLTVVWRSCRILLSTVTWWPTSLVSRLPELWSAISRFIRFYTRWYEYNVPIDVRDDARTSLLFAVWFLVSRSHIGLWFKMSGLWSPFPSYRFLVSGSQLCASGLYIHTILFKTQSQYVPSLVLKITVTGLSGPVSALCGYCFSSVLSSYLQSDEHALYCPRSAAWTRRLGPARGVALPPLLPSFTVYCDQHLMGVY